MNITNNIVTALCNLCLDIKGVVNFGFLAELASSVHMLSIHVQYYSNVHVLSF